MAEEHIGVMIPQSIIGMLGRFIVRENTEHRAARSAHAGAQCTVRHQAPFDFPNALTFIAQHIFKYIIHTANHVLVVLLLQSLQNPIGVRAAFAFRSSIFWNNAGVEMEK